MTSPLDRIRTSVGVTVADGEVIQRSGSPPLAGRVTLEDALAARRGAPTDVTALRTPAIVAGALAAFSAVLYGPVTSWTATQANHNDLFVYDWIARIVTVAGIEGWGPWVAGFGLVALVIAAAWTRGLKDAEAPSIAALTVGGVSSVVPAAPLALALVIGIVAIVLYIILMVLLIAAIVAFIGALLMGSGS